MSTFLIAAAALTALAWMMLWPAMRSRPKSVPNDASARIGNLDILREQLGALDAELAAGSIDAARHRAARIDIERRVLEEESRAPIAAINGRPTSHSLTTLALLCAGIAALAFGLYAALGNPAGLAVASEPPPTAAADDVSPEAMQTMLA